MISSLTFQFVSALTSYSPLAPFATHEPLMVFLTSSAARASNVYSVFSFQAYAESANAALAPSPEHFQLAISLSVVPEPATDQKIVACSSGTTSPTLATAAVQLNKLAVSSLPSAVRFAVTEPKPNLVVRLAFHFASAATSALLSNVAHSKV